MQNDDIDEFYDGYYADGRVDQKRSISARDSMRMIERVARGTTFNHLLDVGSGEGSVINEIEASGFAAKVTAVEISGSGVERCAAVV